MRRTTPREPRVHGRSTAWAAVVLAAVSVAACTAASAGGSTDRAVRATTTTTSTTSTTTTTTTTAPPPSSTTVPPSTEPTTPPPSTASTTSPPTTAAGPPDPGDRDHVLTGFAPYATAGDLTLHHPAAVVELIGLHQSNHEGALDQTPVEGTQWAVEMTPRGRATSPRTSADIVAQPEAEIRSPVTGTVERASTYRLYCRVEDESLVIIPDDDPDLEVKVLHVRGLRVAAGDRVVAGKTVVADAPHALPFTSQVDHLTADPTWPHVHVEVVDPSVPNVPNGGTGSADDC